MRCLGAARSAAWIADSPSLKRDDLKAATSFCAKIGIPLYRITPREIDDPRYAMNPVNRCFYCKSALYEELLFRLGHSAPSTWICSGANLDDWGDYRPGFLAAAAASIRHPLSDCRIDKPLVRALAKYHKLRVWDKPASPCLASRIPYGQPVTIEKLRQIEAAETILIQHGFTVCRVRHHGTTARIEVPVDQLFQLRRHYSDLRRDIIALGFHNIEIDNEGFLSGKLNRVTQIRSANLTNG
jgi:uncharacterized protein